MSGIVGVFDRDGVGIARADLRAMLASIDHRGPDGSGEWYDDTVLLGHQQLQSTPESRFDDQPYRDDGLVVVGDARLDNRDELFEKLHIDGERHRIPDSHLLLASYRRWGKHCPERLIGSFAFAIWDVAEETIFCVRDRFGVKPLYVYSRDDLLAIASEKKALLAHSAVPKEIDEVKVGEYLLDNYDSKERSYFESISRLPPAHAMSVSQSGFTKWQYWDLDPTRTITLQSDSAYERRFRELFETAVRSRLRGTGPVGTELSGGIDSSSVTVMCREISPDHQPVHTFSNVYNEAPSTDEREYIEAVLAAEEYEPHYIDDSEPSVLVDGDLIRKYFDQPIRNELNFSVMKSMIRAKQEGIDVLLGGEQGDSTIGYGFEVLPELLWTGHWLKLYHELYSIGDIFSWDPTNYFIYEVLPSVVPDPIFRIRRRINGEKENIKSVNPIISSEFINRTDLQARYAQSQKGSALPKRARQIQRNALLEPSLVESYEERDLLASGLGMEKRYPFTDKRLVEFCLAIPRSQQLKDGWPRSIARRAMSDLLPEKVQFRREKAAGNEAFRNALQNELSQIQSIIRNPGPVAEYIDFESLQSVYDQFNTNPESDSVGSLWKTLSLSIWLEKTLNE